MNTQELQSATALTPAQQATREALVKGWAARVLALASESTCSILWALRAIEQTDRQTDEQQKRRLPWQARRP